MLNRIEISVLNLKKIYIIPEDNLAIPWKKIIYHEQNVYYIKADLLSYSDIQQNKIESV